MAPCDTGIFPPLHDKPVVYTYYKLHYHEIVSHLPLQVTIK